jgi:hypothetical protein
MMPKYVIGDKISYNSYRTPVKEGTIITIDRKARYPIYRVKVGSRMDTVFQQNINNKVGEEDSAGESNVNALSEL